jgi:hypothetical protein
MLIGAFPSLAFPNAAFPMAAWPGYAPGGGAGPGMPMYPAYKPSRLFVPQLTEEEEEFILMLIAARYNG